MVVQEAVMLAVQKTWEGFFTTLGAGLALAFGVKYVLSHLERLFGVTKEKREQLKKKYDEFMTVMRE